MTPEIKRLRVLLELVETLIIVEARHEGHYDNHEDHARGERYEDCSACRWQGLLGAIRIGLGKGETP